MGIRSDQTLRSGKEPVRKILPVRRGRCKGKAGAVSNENAGHDARSWIFGSAAHRRIRANHVPEWLSRKSTPTPINK
jgi:hypothetical protein